MILMKHSLHAVVLNQIKLYESIKLHDNRRLYCLVSRITFEPMNGCEISDTATVIEVGLVTGL